MYLVDFSLSVITDMRGWCVGFHIFMRWFKINYFLQGGTQKPFITMSIPELWQTDRKVHSGRIHPFIHADREKPSCTYEFNNRIWLCPSIDIFAQFSWHLHYALCYHCVKRWKIVQLSPRKINILFLWLFHQKDMRVGGYDFLKKNLYHTNFIRQ